jgi:hypothetical protein
VQDGMRLFRKYSKGIRLIARHMVFSVADDTHVVTARRHCPLHDSPHRHVARSAHFRRLVRLSFGLDGSLLWFDFKRKKRFRLKGPRIRGGGAVMVVPVFLRFRSTSSGGEPGFESWQKLWRRISTETRHGNFVFRTVDVLRPRFDSVRVTVESSRNTSLTILFSSVEFVVQGNGATEDCCSKCWREMMKKQGDVDAAAAHQQKKKPLAPAAPKESAPEPMDVEPEAPSAQPATEPAAAASAAVAPTASAAPAPASSQTKKKKASYKNMMASMMKQQSMERDLEKEKEALRKVTGGGAFSKIDKI